MEKEKGSRVVEKLAGAAVRLFHGLPLGFYGLSFTVKSFAGFS